jgi:hypothetical protein
MSDALTILQGLLSTSGVIYVRPNDRSRLIAAILAQTDNAVSRSDIKLLDALHELVGELYIRANESSRHELGLLDLGEYLSLLSDSLESGRNPTQDDWLSEYRATLSGL